MQATTYTMEDIRSANRRAGQHWFEPGTMRFFSSRVGSAIYQGPGGIYFVSSEQFSYTSARLYTVRSFDPATGSIGAVGEFNELTRSQAIALAKRSAKG